MKLSRRFIERLKLARTPQYQIANMANVHPALLSKWVIGAQPVKDGDKRLILIGKLIGLEQNEVFDDNDEFCKKDEANI